MTALRTSNGDSMNSPGRWSGGFMVFTVHTVLDWQVRCNSTWGVWKPVSQAELDLILWSKTVWKKFKAVYNLDLTSRDTPTSHAQTASLCRHIDKTKQVHLHVSTVVPFCFGPGLPAQVCPPECVQSKKSSAGRGELFPQHDGRCEPMSVGQTVHVLHKFTAMTPSLSSPPRLRPTQIWQSLLHGTTRPRIWHRHFLSVCFWHVELLNCIRCARLHIDWGAGEASECGTIQLTSCLESLSWIEGISGLWHLFLKEMKTVQLNVFQLVSLNRRLQYNTNIHSVRKWIRLNYAETRGLVQWFCLTAGKTFI